jgi:D-xylose transport system substrate-binding protein
MTCAETGRQKAATSKKGSAMRKGITFAAVGLMAIGGLSACSTGGSNTPAAKTPKIGVILPDSKSSVRWETADRPYLEAAFKAAGVQYNIQNAQGDKAAFQTIADQMITSGVTVLMIVNLDSGTGKAVLDKAKAAGIGTIDYDRLTLGGGADYYVSFDNVAVGKLQGDGLIKCLTDKSAVKPVIAELNGSPTDNNATLFAQGYDGQLAPKYASGDYVKGPNVSVPDWDNTKAGTIFEGMMTSTSNKIDGVLAANDGLGNAAVAVLKRLGLNGKVPVTGQDATVQGLQNVLAGDQCMTVYKAIKQEADGAAQLALALAQNKQVSGLSSVKDTTTNKDVPSKLLVPVAIFKNNVKDVVADNFVKASELCTGAYAALCTANGITVS